MSSNAKQSKVGDKSVKWDDYFGDPTDDLVIVANNGVHFRVSSYRLSKCSSMIRDMVQRWTTTNGSANGDHENVQDKRSELDYHSSVIRQTLNQACCPTYVSDFVLNEATRYARALARVACLDQLGCPTLVHEAWHDLALIAGVQHRGFETLVMASDRDDARLAADSMAFIGAKEVRRLYQSEEYMNAQLDRLQPHWAFCLRPRIFTTTAEGTMAFTKIEEDGWLDWAHSVGRDIARTHKRSRARLSSIKCLAITGPETPSPALSQDEGGVEANST